MYFSPVVLSNFKDVKFMIVSFSGIDSSGKSTQINILKRYCQNQQICVGNIWGKGRGTPGVMLIKGIVRQDRFMTPKQKSEYRAKVYKNSKKRFLLLVASILDLWWYFGLWYRIKSLMYNILICDRYIWDTYIDFRSEFNEYEIDNWWIWKTAVKLSPKPKHSFMFYLSAEESYRRDQQKGDLTLDPLEVKTLKIDKYMKLINNKKWEVVIDGTKDIESISNTIISTIFG